MIKQPKKLQFLKKGMQRRSGRIVRQPIHYEHKAHVLVSDTENDNPLNFKETTEDQYINKWQEAMNQCVLIQSKNF